LVLGSMQVPPQETDVGAVQVVPPTQAPAVQV
jgi:hypothetical protein